MAKNDNPWSHTIFLPKTAFPMRADMARRAPEFVRRWESEDTYGRMVARTKGRRRFVLHDGPPYANGHIHHGHILNKVLKDIIVKYRNLSGTQGAPYVPGWDCHGLPIEQKVAENFRAKKQQATPEQMVAACRDYASEFIGIQMAEFRELGVLADYANCYRTMTKDYEAKILREFGRFLSKGYVYRQNKPVYWSWALETSLAEAEVEYDDHTSPSVYVAFPYDGDGSEIAPELKGEKPELVIWTTTPWTIPANLGLSLHPELDYVAVKTADAAGRGRVFIVAKGLLEAFAAACKLKDPVVVAEFRPGHLERKTARHPLTGRASLIMLGTHVTLEQGTGIVHTAPGHGAEDYVMGRHYDLDVYSPVDSRGRYTADLHENLKDLVGLQVFDANPKVIEKLDAAGALLAQGKVSHSYPHCWRSKKPVIFRATPQWFVSLEHDGLREKSLEAIDGKVQWIPPWGRDRIYNMVANRPDWCISRQRVWGVPIVSYECSGCGHVESTPELVELVARQIEQHGIEVWFAGDVKQLIPAGYKCPRCGQTEWKKGGDILDVWFDSGVSHAAVLEGNPELAWPADLYLEGSDQHRGWFHSSLLTSVATRGGPPYRAVLTHGFVVDHEGKKYSKSNPTYTPPEKTLKTSGPELFRLWVAAEDYRNDIHFGDEILQRLSEMYRKFRNIVRHLLGCLDGFSPAANYVPYDRRPLLDRWIFSSAMVLAAEARAAYENYEFHRVYHGVNQFVTVDLSSIYANATKDRLYILKADDPARRSTQSSMYDVLVTLLTVFAPVCSFTCEEAWGELHRQAPGTAKDAPFGPLAAESVFLNDMPGPSGTELDRHRKLAADFVPLLALREAVNLELEKFRVAGSIGKSEEAKAAVAPKRGEIPADFLRVAAGRDVNRLSLMEELLVVSSFELLPEADTVQIHVGKASGARCGRCWHHSEKTGSCERHPDLCERCIEVVP
ncbi:MAG: isoleucine--tRNA ligase [Deltaproteobacteria bacterium]|nr:isoleucine--tRNA ligase [Deltaproteobacteria bacterium]